MATKFNVQQQIGLGELAAIAERAQEAVKQVRAGMLHPDSVKKPPTFSSGQLGTLCGVDKGKVDYQIKKGDLPGGVMDGSRRRWTLKEARQWSKALRAKKMRPESAEAVAITVANFKGGVTKTTSAVTLAQGLSQRGHDVLLIDCDPQGSATTLFGTLPEEVSSEDTILPLCLGDEQNIESAIRPTYWNGIDIVSAAPMLFQAEYALPARQVRDRTNTYEFWHTLRDGIASVRGKYSVIIFDTSPALSYTTINALLASNGILMPLPPSALDFASSAQFWNLFSDLTAQLMSSTHGEQKSFDFVNVFLTKVDSADTSSGVVREWISAAYGNLLLPIEIPKTTLSSTTSAEFGTVYDVSPSLIDSRTYRRAHAAYERMVDLVEDQIIATWKRKR